MRSNRARTRLCASGPGFAPPEGSEQPRYGPLFDYRPASCENDTQALLAILARHRGKGAAITSRELARDLHLSTRVVREIIAQLVEGGQLIGASVDGNAGGYYMILAAPELEETRAILRSRAREIFARDSALCRAWRRVHGQELQPLLPQIESEE